MPYLLPLVAVGSFLALAASYLGAWHPIGDSLAVFRPLWALALLLSGMMIGGWVAFVLGLAALFAVLPILWAGRPLPSPEQGLAIYQKNLRYDLADPAPVVRDILDSGADLVFLQEISRQNLAVPNDLREELPHQLICEAHSVGAVAILSRRPFRGAPLCLRESGFAAASIDGPDGPVSLVVLHLHWPWPYGQAAQLVSLTSELQALSEPVILAGDFNMVPWGDLLRRLREATGTRRVGPIRPSFVLKGAYPMAIDHILIPRTWTGQARLRDRLGSDHRGLLAMVAPK